MAADVFGQRLVQRPKHDRSRNAVPVSEDNVHGGHKVGRRLSCYSNRPSSVGVVYLGGLVAPLRA